MFCPLLKIFVTLSFFFYCFFFFFFFIIIDFLYRKWHWQGFTEQNCSGKSVLFLYFSSLNATVSTLKLWLIYCSVCSGGEKETVCAAESVCVGLERSRSRLLHC